MDSPATPTRGLKAPPRGAASLRSGLGRTAGHWAAGMTRRCSCGNVRSTLTWVWLTDPKATCGARSWLWHLTGVIQEVSPCRFVLFFFPVLAIRDHPGSGRRPNAFASHGFDGLHGAKPLPLFPLRHGSILPYSPASIRAAALGRAGIEVRGWPSKALYSYRIRLSSARQERRPRSPSGGRAAAGEWPGEPGEEGIEQPNRFCALAVQ